MNRFTSLKQFDSEFSWSLSGLCLKVVCLSQIIHSNYFSITALSQASSVKGSPYITNKNRGFPLVQSGRKEDIFSIFESPNLVWTILVRVAWWSWGILIVSLLDLDLQSFHSCLESIHLLNSHSSTRGIIIADKSYGKYPVRYRTRTRISLPNPLLLPVDLSVITRQLTIIPNLWKCM